MSGKFYTFEASRWTKSYDTLDEAVKAAAKRRFYDRDPDDTYMVVQAVAQVDMVIPTPITTTL